jgi:hypothetical protein
MDSDKWDKMKVVNFKKIPVHPVILVGFFPQVFENLLKSQKKL